MKAVSLVIPATPGDACFVPELLRAVNAGSFVPFEIIVSISCGTEVPAQTIVDIENEFGRAQRGGVILNREILLAAGNRNRGAALATGEVVAFFDADDLPHPQLFETVSFIFSNYDIVHLNHCGTSEPFSDARLGKINVVGADLLYPLYFPNGQFEECVQRAGAYGVGLPEDFGNPITGHTVVARSVLDQVKFRNSWELPFPKAEDYVFCMEVLHRFRKSMIIDAKLSLIRPSVLRGADRHGYRDVSYVPVSSLPTGESR